MQLNALERANLLQRVIEELLLLGWQGNHAVSSTTPKMGNGSTFDVRSGEFMLVTCLWPPTKDKLAQIIHI